MNMYKGQSFLILWILALVGCTGQERDTGYVLTDRHEVKGGNIKAEDLAGIRSAETGYVFERCRDSDLISVSGGDAEHLSYSRDSHGNRVTFPNGSLITLQWTDRNATIYYKNDAFSYSTGMISPDSIRYYVIRNKLIAKYHYWDRGNRICFFVGDDRNVKFYFFEQDQAKKQVFEYLTAVDSIRLVRQ